MANSTMLQSCPIDIHHQTHDSEVLVEVPSVFKSPSVELDSLTGFSVARDINENLDSFDTGLSRLSLSSSNPLSGKSYPPTSHCLWRKYGVGINGEEEEGEQLGQHEMAVYGTHVDERILPGFRYRVRIPSKRRGDRYQFGGRALHLLRIGQGYGKRLTFEDQYANINTNFFWSDTLPNGYAFIISAVQPGDEFVVCHQNGRPFGRATVIATSQHQVEISSSITKDKDVVKRVIVAMQISVQYTCEPHGMMSLRADEIVDVMGVAVVKKSAKGSRAVTRCIEEVEIPGHGECLLYDESE